MTLYYTVLDCIILHSIIGPCMSIDEFGYAQSDFEAVVSRLTEPRQAAPWRTSSTLCQAGRADL